MTLTELRRRLDQLMSALPRPRVPGLPAGLGWIRQLTPDELDRLEELYGAAEDERREMTEAEALTAIAIEAGARARMAGCERP
jgi:hypothetical protein